MTAKPTPEDDYLMAAHEAVAKMFNEAEHKIKVTAHKLTDDLMRVCAEAQNELRELALKERERRDADA